MTQPTTSAVDLIAQKTSEYDQLPGLILGLDGWIIRSVPKELRGQFLQGYEKLLRVVFHPDRYQDPTQKLSRQSYLQSVNEAVRFMSADEFSYEMAADSVPTRKNPVVTLRDAVDVRDGIIGRVNDELSEAQQLLESERKKVRQIRTQMAKQAYVAEFQEKIAHQLRHVVRYAVNQFPVPIEFDRAQVAGSFITWRAPDSLLVKAIAHYASRSHLRAENDWFKEGHWVSDLAQSGMLEEATEINLHKGNDQDKELVVVGALTLPHLCEYIRSLMGYPVGKQEDKDKTIADTAIALKGISEPLLDDAEKTLFRAQLAPYAMPFYGPDMMLMVRQGGDTHRLFLVRSVDAGINPFTAIRSGLERSLKRERSANLLAEQKLREASKQKTKLRSALKSYKKWSESEKLDAPSRALRMDGAIKVLDELLNPPKKKLTPTEK